MSTYDKLKRTSGFTLIELLVVIAIIGILSSVVLASLNGARESSRDARRQTDLNQIRTSLALYRDSCDSYPSSTGATVREALGSGGDCTLGEFMSQVPTDPSSGNYGYSYNSTGDNYCLAASLEGGSAPSDSATTTDSACDTADDAIDDNGGATYYLVN